MHPIRPNPPNEGNSLYESECNVHPCFSKTVSPPQDRAPSKTPPGRTSGGTLIIASVIGREFALAHLGPLIGDMTDDRLVEVLETVMPLPYYLIELCACDSGPLLMGFQTFSGVGGMSKWETPRWASASTTAFSTAGTATMVGGAPITVV